MRKWIFEIVLAAMVFSPFCGFQNSLWAQDDDNVDIEEELDAEDSLEEQAEEKTEEKTEEKAEVADPQLTVQEKSKKSISPEASDLPDVELEDRLFEIFSGLRGPIEDKDWGEIVKSRKSENYTIQKGDTLWDISRAFFGDPFFWPKIWSLNKDIYNPHFVISKQKLKFYPGTLTQEPTIEIEEPQQSMSIEMAGTLTPEEKAILPDLGEDELLPSEGLRATTVEEVVIPPTRRKSTARLPVIPPSLPIWDVTSGGKVSSNLIFSGKPLSQPAEVIVPLVSFVAEEFPEDDGRIVRINNDQLIGSNFQPIYVEVSGGKLGESLLVISQLKKPRKFFKKVNGVPVSVDGQLKLVEVIDEGAELFRAIITANTNAVAVGAKLIRQTFPTVELSIKGALQNISGEITGGFLDGQTEIFGVGYFVYLNVGTSDGIKVGGLLSVLANEELRDKKTLDELNSREVGILKIVHTQDSVSTGVIVAASDAILPGDFTGKPGPLLREQLKLTRSSGFKRDLLQELSDEELIGEEDAPITTSKKNEVEEIDLDEIEDDESDSESEEEEE
ncbi:MAG: LysM peptidoglycan-binding domain-containing protein [Pseudomonadota bacterium]|nr:LysM peptidoglycan-binding domain-containing protein [Pseudomonadota bacterium]